MKRLIFTVLALSFATTLAAQVEDEWDKLMKESKESVTSEFDSFVKQANKEFEDFRRQANESYAKFMEEAWKSFNVMDAEEAPWTQPKPVVPLEDVAPETNAMIEYDEVIESPSDRIPEATLPEGSLTEVEVRLQGQPEPMEPILPVYESDYSVQNLFLYGSSFPVRVEPSKEVSMKLKDPSEKNVARMWRKLSSPYYDNIVAECLQQRKERSLCDWAYVKFTEQMANKYFEPGSNEAVVLQMYILTQSGYQMRMARAGKKLTLLMGSKEKLYQYKYFIMDKVQYYIIDKSMKDKSMNVYNRAFPNEKLLSLAMVQPKLNVNKTAKRTITAYNKPDLKINLVFNQNLLDFYTDCPVSSQWDYYSKASFSNEVKQTLYPALRSAIEGKNEVDAVEFLLNFVQTTFEYKTDQAQFGYERPLYPDESLYYPYCDCEDRSILFSCLVRELVGLDVVLLAYPAHLSTAVHFNRDVKGDYVMVDGLKYVVCEPTAVLGAPVGHGGSKYRDKKPKIMKF
jgi:hypothetical protein